MVGVGLECQRSGRGGTTAPPRVATWRTRPQNAQDSTAAMSADARTAVSTVRTLHRSAAAALPALVGVKRPGVQDAVADQVEPRRGAGPQSIEGIELQLKNRVSRLGFDERQRNHAIEEEVIRVATR